jgi:diadenosine tetraphosphatase ApaH/serine/threonine PP2A family protein phosphatase
VLNTERIICCGDIVGYGPWPNECIEEVQNQKMVTVKGNHDAAVVEEIDVLTFTPDAAWAVEWTVDQLSLENKTFLKALPLREEAEGILVVHGSPRNPIWEYILDGWAALANFHEFDFHLCLHGHSHIPGVFVFKEGNIRFLRGDIEIKEGERYLINPGSVGQPRDGDWKASFVILDLGGNRIEFYRVEYNVRKTREEMIKSGLPKRLYDRILVGV